MAKKYFSEQVNSYDKSQIDASATYRHIWNEYQKLNIRYHILCAEYVKMAAERYAAPPNDAALKTLFDAEVQASRILFDAQTEAERVMVMAMKQEKTTNTANQAEPNAACKTTKDIQRLKAALVGLKILKTRAFVNKPH